MEFSHCIHACVLAGAAMLLRALAKGWLGNLCAVLSCKEMRCHENKNLAMLACAACAREKQHLLEQLLKETKMNQSENSMPNTGYNLFCQDGLQVTHSPHTD